MALLLVGGVYFLARLPDVGDAEVRVAVLLRAHHGIESGLPIPARLAKAIAAGEDERFYSPHGIDILGLLRAGQVDLLHRSMREGGSTITQQLAKALDIQDDHSLGAKLQSGISPWHTSGSGTCLTRWCDRGCSPRRQRMRHMRN